MKFIVNLMFFILILLCFYFKFVDFKVKRKIQKTDWIVLRNSRCKSKILTWVSSLKIVNKIDKILNISGKPLGLNGVKFFVINFFFLFSIISLFLLNFFELASRLFIIFLCMNLVVIIYYVFQNSSVYNDLLYVVQGLYLQMSSGVSLKDSLKSISILCENKRFRNSIVALSTVYQLSGYDIKKSTNNLIEEYNIPEMRLFVNALNQQFSSSVSVDILEDLYFSLKDKYIEKVKTDTKVKIIYITFGVVLILVNICALAIVPMFITALNDLNKIFN